MYTWFRMNVRGGPDLVGDTGHEGAKRGEPLALPHLFARRLQGCRLGLLGRDVPQEQGGPFPRHERVGGQGKPRAWWAEGEALRRAGGRHPGTSGR